MTIRAVLDTNVLISGVIAPDGPPRRVIEAWHQGKIALVTSEAIIDEVVRVLRYPKIYEAYNLIEEAITAVTESLWYDAEIVPGDYEARASVDPDDDKFLACAVEGHAEYIISGDDDLLDLGTYRDVLIVTPQQFVKVLHAKEQAAERRA